MTTLKRWPLRSSAFTGTFSRARFMTMKALEPTPMSTEPAASSCGTLEPGPPCTMLTSSPRLAYSPSASAS